MSVLIETSLGDLVIDLYIDHAPRTSLNFLKLCAYHYYNDHLIFSITSILFRTGCPENNGTSGTSIYALTAPPGPAYIPHEYHSKLTHKKRGTVSMTSGGEDLGSGSQFFVTLRDGLTHLDRKHTVFGFVAEGFDTLDKISRAFVDDKGKPLMNIRLRHTIVLHDPFPPMKGLPDPRSSPEPIEDGDEVDGDVDRMVKKKDESDQEEKALKREAFSRAEVLEMIGDIEHADLAPPDTVLFVCKLNPVTTSEDLDTVFSRFGNCRADVKYDQDGESLCYAFVEFEKKEACEKAYFAMDGIIIDDRRIKVDFSQSVSRIAHSGPALREGNGSRLVRDPSHTYRRRPRMEPRRREENNKRSEEIRGDKTAVHRNGRHRMEDEEQRVEIIKRSRRGYHWRDEESAEKGRRSRFRDGEESFYAHDDGQKHRNRDSRGRKHEDHDDRRGSGHYRWRGYHERDQRRELENRSRGGRYNENKVEEEPRHRHRYDSRNENENYNGRSRNARYERYWGSGSTKEESDGGYRGVVAHEFYYTSSDNKSEKGTRYSRGQLRHGDDDGDRLYHRGKRR